MVHTYYVILGVILHFFLRRILQPMFWLRKKSSFRMSTIKVKFQKKLFKITGVALQNKRREALFQFILSFKDNQSFFLHNKKGEIET